MNGSDCLDPATCDLRQIRLCLPAQLPVELIYKDDTGDDIDPAARFEESLAERVPLEGAPGRALAFCPCEGCASHPIDRFAEWARTLVMESTPPRAGKIIRVRCVAGCSTKLLATAIAEYIMSDERQRARNAACEQISRGVRLRPRKGGMP